MRHLSRIVKYSLGLLGLFVALQAAVRLLRRLLPQPMPPGLRFLDSPVREWTLPRASVLKHIGLAPGMSVLEVGLGPGSLTVEAARLVGPQGRLSAVDPEPRMVAIVREKIEEDGLDNVELRVASPTRLPFADGTFDVVFLATVLGEIPDKGRALRELRRVLKKDGRLSVTEAFADADYMLMTEVVGWANTVGFELVEEHGSAFLYTLNFRSLFGP